MLQDGEGPFQDVLESQLQKKVTSYITPHGRFWYRFQLGDDPNNYFQMNIETQRPRPIRRRPVYVGPEDVQKGALNL